MADILPLRPLDVLAPVPTDPAAQLPAWARAEAERRHALVLLAGRGGNPGVSEPTLRRWRKALDAGGIAALAPAYKGRQRTEQPWEARALQYVQLPSRMNSGEIAFNLRRDGYADVTPAQVRSYRRSLPSNLDLTSPKKLGKHYYRLNETPYVIRDWGSVPVGYLLEMDGHTCDFYIEDPANGGYFRPELTLLWDVRSQYIVDFWLCRFENSMDLRWLLSSAFTQWDHVPHELHVDPGAAKGRTMSDPVVGYCAKLDIDIHFALPGNARGKGLTEGGFKLFEGRFGKTMPTYLHDRTDDAMRLFAAKWERNEFARVNIRQLYEMIRTRFVEPTRNEPRDGLDGKTPAELWATLQRNPVIAPIAALCRPRDKRVVSNGRITLDKRRYQLPQPTRAEWEDKDVIVEYDEWRDERVWIYTLDGRYLCEAPLVHRQHGIPASRVEQRLLETQRGREKRLQVKLAAVAEQSRLPIAGYSVMDALEAPESIAPPSNAEQVLLSGTSFTTPAPQPAPAPRVISAAALEHLQAEVAAEAETESTTSHDRIRRALALEARVAAGETLADADAHWLAIYTTGAEYHSRRALMDDFNLNPES